MTGKDILIKSIGNKKASDAFRAIVASLGRDDVTDILLNWEDCELGDDGNSIIQYVGRDRDLKLRRTGIGGGGGENLCAEAGPEIRRPGEVRAVNGEFLHPSGQERAGRSVREAGALGEERGGEGQGEHNAERDVLPHLGPRPRREIPRPANYRDGDP